MRLTGKQAHVLDNLDRVCARVPQVTTFDKRQRFLLDGWDCTQQITSLRAKGMCRLAGRTLARLPGQQDTA